MCATFFNFFEIQTKNLQQSQILILKIPGGFNADLPPTGATTQFNNHHIGNGIQANGQSNGKAKEKLPQRRSSFFGSLFSSSNKNLSSGNLLQSNGYAGLVFSLTFVFS